MLIQLEKELESQLLIQKLLLQEELVLNFYFLTIITTVKLVEKMDNVNF